MGHIYKVVVPL